MPSINHKNFVPVPPLSHECSEGHYRHDPYGDCPQCEQEAEKSTILKEVQS
jgi:hypothetical protein